MAQENKERRSSFEWNQFVRLRTCEELEDYFLGKEHGMEYEHGDYCHYTSIKKINNILDKQCFWLTSVCGFNDTRDREQFGDERDLYFSLCFSTGVNENLPLWYFYSGLDGKGGRLRLTPGCVRTLIDKGTYQLVRARKISDTEEEILGSIPLERDKTMEIQFKDIVYAKEPKEEGNWSLKYNTMTNYNIPREEFEAYQQKNRGFCKGLIWYYEKETRLLARVIGEAEQCLRNWRNEDEEKEEEEKIQYRIELKFKEDLLKWMQIRLAPNIRDDRRKVDELVKENPGIQKLADRTSPIRPSEYAGTVAFHFQFGWCENCTKNRKGKQGEHGNG